MSYLGKCKLWFGGVLHFLVRRTLFANTSEILCKYFALAGCILCRYLCRNDSGACKKFFYALSACVCAEIVNWGGGCFCHRLMPAKHGRYKLCTLQATRGLQIQKQRQKIYKYKLQRQTRTKCKSDRHKSNQNVFRWNFLNELAVWMELLGDYGWDWVMWFRF